MMNLKTLITLQGIAAVSFGAATASAGVENLVQNGSFEESPFTATWDLFDQIPGWQPSNGVQIELQRNVRSWDAKHGEYYAELDSHGPGEGPLGLFQDLSTTPEQQYDLSLWFSPRPGVSSNTLEVLWGNEVVGSYDANGSGLQNTQWQAINLSVTAASELTRLEFRLGDTRDTLGTFIDDVNVTAVPTPAAAALFGLGGLCATRRRR